MSLSIKDLLRERSLSEGLAEKIDIILDLHQQILTLQKTVEDLKKEIETLKKH